MKLHIALLAAMIATALAGCSLKGGDDQPRGNAQPGDPCGGTIDCTPGSVCFSNVCVGEGPLRFSLSWTEDTDFDLHVLTPNDNEIYFSNRAADNGVIDVDDCINGSCTRPDESHVENVFFMEGAPTGTYEYWVVNYDCEVSGDYTLEAALDGTIADTTQGTLPAECASSEHLTFEY